MTSNRFGGFWTVDKLDVLRNYLRFFCIALEHQPHPARPYQLVYIDAFAGTGRCAVKTAAGHQLVVDGSAKIALDCTPGFTSYRFIEKKRAHQAELQALIDTHPNGSRAALAKQSADAALEGVLKDYDWRRTRGVLFLDPFGLQCSWPMLQQIRETEALDVFFLVSLSGLYRQAAVKESKVDPGKAASLSRFLGTDEWRDAIYTTEQGDLFDGPQRSRPPGWEDLLNYTTQRLRSLFPYVGEPNLMAMQSGAPLFALYFAVSNPNPLALNLAKRVSSNILSKLPR